MMGIRSEEIRAVEDPLYWVYSRIAARNYKVSQETTRDQYLHGQWEAGLTLSGTQLWVERIFPSHKRFGVRFPMFHSWNVCIVSPRTLPPLLSRFAIIVLPCRPVRGSPEASFQEVLRNRSLLPPAPRGAIVSSVVYETII